MPTPALHPDAVATKYATLKHWRDSRVTGRKATLGGWDVTRREDGQLHVSARIRGRDAAAALQAFMNRQALFLAQRTAPGTGDLLPFLDVTVPGRTSACWRLSGVWVEVWHPDTVAAGPRPAQLVSAPAEVAAPGTSGRKATGVLVGPGGRLTFTRRNKTKKENTTR